MEKTRTTHIPVLAEEVLNFLPLEKDAPRIIDCTVGCGGHSSLILKKNLKAEVLGIDRDGEALKWAGKNLSFASGRFRSAHGVFSDMKNLATEAGWVDVDGVLMDLGVSSPQLDNAERGFSLRMDGPLDMRMDKRSPGTASRFINNASREELERVFRDYGEIRANRRLAKAIVERRRNKPFTTTLELAEACEEALGKSVPGRLPTPTLCFQAVRIAVNRELEELEAGLKSALEILKPGGIMTVISFHSLEDRIVKNFFRRGASECVCPPGFPVCVCGKTKELKILTKKPVKATKAEIEKNSRASCAKLRAMEKTGKGK